METISINSSVPLADITRAYPPLKEDLREIGALRGCCCHVDGLLGDALADAGLDKQQQEAFITQLQHQVNVWYGHRDTTTLNITNQANEQLTQILKDKQQQCVRISMDQDVFVFDLCNTPDQKDITVNKTPLVVLTQPAHQRLQGATLDFTGRFRIIQPNNTQCCGGC